VDSMASLLRDLLVQTPESTRLGLLRRGTIVFSQGQLADAGYLVDDGMVKLTRTNLLGERTILKICGPGQIAGIEVTSEEVWHYHTEAEVMDSAVLYQIPREALKRAMVGNPKLANAVSSYLLNEILEMAHKVELLCLHDVEYRILNHLEALLKQLKPQETGGIYQLPITQLELADLIGATRETTSTTLNQLERRGVVKLSRRMLSIESPGHLQHSAPGKSSHAARNGSG
jgi:CRP-like cAMP-binding protein